MTVILVYLLTLKRSLSSTISFLLNTRQLSLLTYNEDKAQHKSYPQQSGKNIRETHWFEIGLFSGVSCDDFLFIIFHFRI